MQAEQGDLAPLQAAAEERLRALAAGCDSALTINAVTLTANEDMSVTLHIDTDPPGGAGYLMGLLVGAGLSARTMLPSRIPAHTPSESGATQDGVRFDCRADLILCLNAVRHLTGLPALSLQDGQPVPEAGRCCL